METTLTGADTDSSGTLNELELFSMLDSLGSTLSRETIDSFFTRHGKTTVDGALTAEELVQCLEAELHKPDAERQRVRPPADAQADPAGTTASGSSTPGMQAALSLADNANAGGFSFTGSNQFVAEPEEREPPSVLPLANTAGAGNAQQAAGLALRQLSLDSSAGDVNGSMDSSGSGSREPVVERVISLKRCPFCHKPRLGKKNEVDIVSHLSICASQDWGAVGTLVVGSFVTSSQAHRKFFTKVCGCTARVG